MSLSRQSINSTYQHLRYTKHHLKCKKSMQRRTGDFKILTESLYPGVLILIDKKGKIECYPNGVS